MEQTPSINPVPTVNPVMEQTPSINPVPTVNPSIEQTPQQTANPSPNNEILTTNGSQPFDINSMFANNK